MVNIEVNQPLWLVGDKTFIPSLLLRRGCEFTCSIICEFLY